MRNFILAVAVIALFGCKKDKAPEAAGSAAPLPAEGSAAPTPTTPEPPAAGARPASVTEAQAASFDKMAVAMEAFGKDVTAAGNDCAKVASAIGVHAAGLKAAKEATIAANVNAEDVAVKGWIEATYGARIATVMAGYAALSAKCAADKAFTAAAAGLELGAAATVKAEESVNKALDDYGKAMDKAGKALDEANKATDEAGKTVDKAGKAVDKAGAKVEGDAKVKVKE